MADSTNMSHKQNTTKKEEKAQTNNSIKVASDYSGHRRYLQERVRIDFAFTQKGVRQPYCFICRCESVKVTHKQDSEELTRSDSVESYAFALDGQTHEIQLSGIDTVQKRFFEYFLEKQAADPDGANSNALYMSSMVKITLYHYHPTSGEKLKEVQFSKCILEEISKENNKTFDAKFKGLAAKFENTRV